MSEIEFNFFGTFYSYGVLHEKTLLKTNTVTKSDINIYINYLESFYKYFITGILSNYFCNDIITLILSFLLKKKHQYAVLITV